ncbi:MAG TPA: NAD kinase [Bacteroidales bacterium]|nr:NAD kinase [Bacteroidales bacterium]
MNIALFGKSISGEQSPYLNLMLDKLRQSGADIFVYGPFLAALRQYTGISDEAGTFSSHADLPCDTDILLSIGGDGTLLDTLPIVRDTRIPLLGINTGRLGFLSSVSRQDVDHAIEALVTGRYGIQERSLIQLESPIGIFGDINYALNEATVFRKEATSLIVIKVYVNGIFVNAYWADGLIVATPTGSTAYSLSAGGPILTPDSGNFVITPIATHNLSVRPIVIPDSSIIQIKVVGRHTQFTLSMDSRMAVVDQSFELIFRKAPFTIRLVETEGKDFFSTIREKLLWGLDVRN